MERSTETRTNEKQANIFNVDLNSKNLEEEFEDFHRKRKKEQTQISSQNNSVKKKVFSMQSQSKIIDENSNKKNLVFEKKNFTQKVNRSFERKKLSSSFHCSDSKEKKSNLVLKRSDISLKAKKN